MHKRVSGLLGKIRSMNLNKFSTQYRAGMGVELVETILEHEERKTHAVPFAAREVGVGDSTLRRAMTIRNNAIPEVFDAFCKTATLALDDALEIARMPKQEQLAALEQKQTKAKIRNSHQRALKSAQFRLSKKTKKEHVERIQELGSELQSLLDKSSSYTLRYNRVKQLGDELAALASRFEG